MKEGDCFTQNFVVDQQTMDKFVDLFNDRNPLHTDEQFAKNKGFDSVVVHGNVLNGFLSYFIGECLPDKNVIIHSQEIKYKQPVYVDDRLSFTAKIDGIHLSVNAVDFIFHFTNQDGQNVAQGRFQIGMFK